MAQLVPPIFANDLLWINLVVCPKLSISVLVQENGLKDMRFVRLRKWKLTLVVSYVETQVKLASVFIIGSNQIHWSEFLARKIATGSLISPRQRVDRMILVIFDFVVLFDIIAIRVCDRKIIGKNS